MNNYSVYQRLKCGFDSGVKADIGTIQDMEKKLALPPTIKFEPVKEGAVLIFGASGFVGASLIEILKGLGCNVITPTRSDCDCYHNGNEVAQFMLDFREPIKYVINLAAFVGGIGLNKQYPYDMGMINAKIGLNILEAILAYGQIGSRHHTPKLIQVGTVCMYPCIPPVIPFEERSLWDGFPERTNAPYGMAKKFIGLMAQCASQQYGIQTVNLIPTNMYGPGDDFSDNASHVIPAMIKKVYLANKTKDRRLVLWGDGSPTREFLYVDDFCNAICAAMVSTDSRVNSGEFINIGSGVETSMVDLVRSIIDAFGYWNNIEIDWDRSKPNGQPRRSLNLSIAQELLGYQPNIDLKTGLKTTVDWFLQNIAPIIDLELSSK